MKPRNDPSTKPYYRCLSCPRFRNSCAGIPTRDMTLQEWCEYVRDVSDVFHLTNAYIAEKSEVSIKTIEQIEAINSGKDIFRGTARRVEIVVFGPVGSHYCCLDHDPVAAADQIAALKEEMASLKKDKARLEKIVDKFIYVD